MSSTEEFLNLYKEFESVLRDKRIDYRDFESMLDDATENKLRVCRRLRNFLSHNNNDGFVVISEKQIAFMKEIIENQKGNADVLQRYVKPAALSSCNINETCKESLVKFSKLDTECLPVYDASRGILGLISSVDVIMRMARNKDAIIKEIPVSTKNIACFAADTPIDKIKQCKASVICCTDDGSAFGKLLGVYFLRH